MQHLKKKFKSAFSGIKEFIFSEKDNYIHFTAILLVIAAGFFFSINSVEWLAIIICIGIVITSEMINQSIEKICNYIQPKSDEQIRKTKDISAGAVLFATIISVIVALVIFIPKIMLLLK